jgi:acyl dehydratase
MEVAQERIQLFADATDDHQWIHVDPERAKQGPFGAPIAHGYLTLSLVNRFLPEIVEVRGISMGVNYGADRIRFPAPLKVGSRIRGGAELIEVENTRDGGVQAKIRVTVEIEGGERPACVVDTISRYYPAR